MFITPTAPNSTVQLELFPDEILPDERYRLMLDPRLHRPSGLKSNRELLKDLAEFKVSNREMMEVYEKLMQSHILHHDIGTPINELWKILRSNFVPIETINKVINFLYDRCKFVELIKEKDGTEQFYLRPKCERPQGPCEWISQLNYLV